MLDAVFLDGIDEITVPGLTQWDMGQQLRITLPSLPSTFQVHFGFRGSDVAPAVEATSSGGVAIVNIPNMVLQQSGTVTAWVYLAAGDVSKTVKTIRMPVVARKQPSDYAYTEIELLNYETVIVKAEYYADIAQEFGSNTENIEARISINDKRIANLEQGITPSPYVTDDTIAFAKVVPENALPYAEVSIVGGMTHKIDNTLQSAPVTEVKGAEGGLHIIIPEDVQNLDGYGDGVNGSAYNHIDWEKKQFVKCVHKIDLSTLTWSKNADNQYYASLPISAKTAYVTNHICSKYATSAQGAYNNSQDKTISLATGRAWVRDTDYATASAFRASLSGVMLCYEIAPIITDISDTLPADNYITVEGGGTVTMVNEHSLAVPSKITYMTKGGDSA